MRGGTTATLSTVSVVLAAVVPLPVAAVGWTPPVNVPWTPAANVVVIGGMGWETVDQPTMRAILDSRFDKPENTFVNIEWPAALGSLGDSVAVASGDLYEHVMSTDGPQVAIGVSGSTFVVNEIMRRLADDPDPGKPAPQDISFVIIGDGERGFIPAVVPFTGWDLPLVGYTTQPIPVTPYDAIVVTGEYDGLADWPDRPWNLLAVLNALVGSPATEATDIHWQSIWVDLDTVPAANVTRERNAAGGTTTSYLVPTPVVPLLYPLRDHGVPEEVIGVLNSVLKPVIDAGYRRNDPPWLKAITGPEPVAMIADDGEGSAAVRIAAGPQPAPRATRTRSRPAPPPAATATAKIPGVRADASRVAGHPAVGRAAR
jgi:hypothetical protein